ncbi:MAG TPA: FAD binding domain-containing protein [Phycisphaerae bacterium]|nr:FAD binding domain-containing protein [Phycisphaerae bacterium]
MIREYHAPATVEEAVALKERLAGSAVFLAGGTEVNSEAFSFAPEHIISLQRLGLSDIRQTKSELVLGACCTIQQVIESADVPDIIKAAGRHVFNRNIRNMATVGGQLGSNRSCSNLLPIFVVLEATVDLAVPGGTRAIPALQYITEERKEMITRIRIRTGALARQAAVEKYSRTANDLSILTAAVTLAREGDAIIDPVIAAGGVAKHVIRLEGVEQALDGQTPPKRDAIERLVAGNVSPITDLRGSEEFKRQIAGVLVAKAILRAYRHGGEQAQ